MNGKIKYKKRIWDVELIEYQKSGHMGLCIVEVADTDIVEDHLITVYVRTLKSDEIAIWNFDGFEGVLEALIKAEIVQEPHNYIEKNYADLRYLVPIVRLKNSFMDLSGIKPSQPKQKSHSIANSAKPAATK
jgi:hypothetical protein